MKPFHGRHFQGEIILWAGRWYYKYGMSYRELQEMLAERGVKVDHTTISAHMTALSRVGVPYTPEQIAAAPKEVQGKTEMEAVIAYLQSLGLALANK